jgi:formiminotetrahydrofolate cyclodeaminase
MNVMTDHEERLEDRTIGNYLDALASSAAAPGGGSVAGLIGALSAALGEMVISLTRNADPALEEVAGKLRAFRSSAMASSAADEMAYSSFVDASRMPKETGEDKARRTATMQEALEEAAAVPLELAGTAIQLLEHFEPVVRLGSKHVLSDMATAITLAVACVDCSLINVRVNLPMMKNIEVAGSLRGKAQKVEQQAHALAEELRDELNKR